MPQYYVPKSEFKILKDSEIEPYISMADGKMKAVLAIAFLSGARIEEVLRLKRKDILIKSEEHEMGITFQTLKRNDNFLREFLVDLSKDPFTNHILDYVKPIEDRERYLFIRPNVKNHKRIFQKKLHRMNEKLWGTSHMQNCRIVDKVDRRRSGDKVRHVWDCAKGCSYRNYLSFHMLRHSRLSFLGRSQRASTWEMVSVTGHKSPDSLKEYLIHDVARRFKGNLSNP